MLKTIYVTFIVTLLISGSGDAHAFDCTGSDSTGNQKILSDIARYVEAARTELFNVPETIISPHEAQYIGSTFTELLALLPSIRFSFLGNDPNCSSTVRAFVDLRDALKVNICPNACRSGIRDLLIHELIHAAGEENELRTTLNTALVSILNGLEPEYPAYIESDDAIGIREVIRKVYEWKKNPKYLPNDLPSHFVIDSAQIKKRIANGTWILLTRPNTLELRKQPGFENFRCTLEIPQIYSSTMTVSASNFKQEPYKNSFQNMVFYSFDLNGPFVGKITCPSSLPYPPTLEQISQHFEGMIKGLRGPKH